MSYAMSAIIRRKLSEENNPERREALLQLLALYEPAPGTIDSDLIRGTLVVPVQFSRA